VNRRNAACRAALDLLETEGLVTRSTSERKDRAGRTKRVDVFSAVAE